MIWAFLWLGLLTLVFVLHLRKDSLELRRINELEEEIGALKRQK